MAIVTKVMHSDPGHAWLAVKLSEIKMLGIETSISSYSYVKGKTAYLEEDCDAGKFIAAMQTKGIEVNVKEGAQRERSPIRYFKSYKAELVK
tara:strand:+ start:181 stop:456 length:276 start_codon:yes stop_codon:yes gene_type:complete